MFRFFAALTAFFLATAATAQDFPALFSVTNVASSDWLNIRAEPSARTEIVGRFDYNQTGIEVVGLSEDRRWGLVRTEDGIGWSAIRFLRKEREDSWQDGRQTLTCHGTEPFWNLSLLLPTDRADFDSLAEGRMTFHTDAPNLPFTRHPRTLAVPFSGPRNGMAVVRQGVCSNGMSDHLYGLEVQVYWRGAPEGLSGCCMLGH